MLVRMLVGISGPHYTLDPGDEFHFPDDEAQRLVEAGFAEYAGADAQTVKRPGRARKKPDVVSAPGTDGSE